MKKKETQTVTAEVVTAIVCNLCGYEGPAQPGADDVPGVWATLSAFWGYGSPKDGQTDEAHVCESCYDTRIAPLFTISPVLRMPYSDPAFEARE